MNSSGTRECLCLWLMNDNVCSNSMRGTIQSQASLFTMSAFRQFCTIKIWPSKTQTDVTVVINIFVCVRDVISTRAHTLTRTHRAMLLRFFSSVVSLMQLQRWGKKKKRAEWMYFPDQVEQLIPLRGQAPLHLQASSLSDEMCLIHNYIKHQLIPDLTLQRGLLRNRKGQRSLKQSPGLSLSPCGFLGIPLLTVMLYDISWLIIQLA